MDGLSKTNIANIYINKSIDIVRIYTTTDLNQSVKHFEYLHNSTVVP